MVKNKISEKKSKVAGDIDLILIVINCADIILIGMSWIIKQTKLRYWLGQIFMLAIKQVKKLIYNFYSAEIFI